MFGLLGLAGLSAFIFGCSMESTYKFEEKGWRPPVYSTVSKMVTRSTLCHHTFTTWLIIMMALVCAALAWTAFAMRPQPVVGWSFVAFGGYAVAVAGMVACGAAVLLVNRAKA